MKNKIICGLILVVIFVFTTLAVYADTENQVRVVLRKTLFEHFKGLMHTTLERVEVLDLLEFYLENEDITENLTKWDEPGNNSYKTIREILNKVVNEYGDDVKTECVNRCNNSVCDQELCKGGNCPCWETGETCSRDCIVNKNECSPKGTKVCEGEYLKSCVEAPGQNYLIWAKKLCEYGCENTDCIVVEPAKCKELGSIISEGYGGLCRDSKYDKRGDIDNDGDIDGNDLKSYDENKYNKEWCDENLQKTLDPCAAFNCTDSDPNDDIYIKGVCNDINGEYADACDKQYSCYNGVCKAYSMVCPYGCNGVCKKLPSCLEQGGDICTGNEICLGNKVISSDNVNCCSIECKIPIWDNCSQCGKGLFNICDKEECLSIAEECYFNGKCFSCANAICLDFSNEQMCINNDCGKLCEWDNGCVEPQYENCGEKYGSDFWCGDYQDFNAECENKGIIYNSSCLSISGGVGIFCMKCSPQCFDSDGGKNYEKKGIVEGEPSLMYPDNYADDYCAGDVLREFYCGSDNKVYYEDIRCVNCSNSVCMQSLLTYGKHCGNESPCDSSLYCKPSGRYGEQEKYCCYNNECASVMHGPCVGDGGKDIRDFPPPTVTLTCESGKWVEPLPDVVCNDSDGGKVYYIKGVTHGLPSGMYNNDVGSDECVNATAPFGLKEFYCGTDNKVYYEEVNCTKSCGNGACI